MSMMFSRSSRFLESNSHSATKCELTFASTVAGAIMDECSLSGTGPLTATPTGGRSRCGIGPRSRGNLRHS
jgi:hypothetical protein